MSAFNAPVLQGAAAAARAGAGCELGQGRVEGLTKLVQQYLLEQTAVRVQRRLHNERTAGAAVGAEEVCA
eukprot:1159989-Pelagomonas_calceolata.AAC.10